MRRIYDVGFEHKKWLIDERIKRNRTYAILVRFMFEPLLRNLLEFDLVDSIDLADIIDVDIIGIVLVLRDNRYFLMYRKFNPYA